MKTFYKTFLLLLLNVSFLVFNSFSQQALEIEWQHCYGGSDAEIIGHSGSLTKTFDGGFAITGSTRSYSSFGDRDVYAVKIDSTGNQEWDLSWGTQSDEDAYSIIQTKDSGYAIIGDLGPPDFDLFVSKWDGNNVFDNAFGGSANEIGTSIIQTNDGGYVFAGTSSSDDGDVSGHHGPVWKNDYWIGKLDSAGNLQWEKSLGGSLHDWCMNVIATYDGGYAIAGYAYSIDGDVSFNHDTNGISADIWIVKLDSMGNIIWEKSYGGTKQDEAFSIIQTSDSGYAVAGWTSSTDGDVTGLHGTGPDYWILKLDFAGTLIWQKCLGSFHEDRASSIIQTNNGGYAIAGKSDFNDGDVTGNHGYPDYWVAFLDSSGNLQYQKSLGGSWYDWAVSIVQTGNNEYVVAGQTASNDSDVTGNHGSADFWVVKLVPDTITSISNLQIPNSNLQIFPNPSPGIFQITFPSSSNQKTNYTLEVINTLGQAVFAKQLQTSNSKLQTNLDLSFLPKGIYVLKINNDENSFSKKVIIE